MEFKEILQKRISCRKYDGRPVEREKLVAILEAARLAPSAHNSQRWMFIAVDDPEKRAQVAQAIMFEEYKINAFAPNVPAFIVLVKLSHAELPKYAEDYPKASRMWDCDIGIAAQQICLAATDLGLGSVIMGMLHEEELKRALDIPEELEVPLVIGLGYPQSAEVRLRPRKELAEIARLNGFNGRLE